MHCDICCVTATSPNRNVTLRTRCPTPAPHSKPRGTRLPSEKRRRANFRPPSSIFTTIWPSSWRSRRPSWRSYGSIGDDGGDLPGSISVSDSGNKERPSCRRGPERIGAGRTIGAGSAAGGGTQTGDCQGPDIDRGSRGAGRTDDAGGSGIAVAVDLLQRLGQSSHAFGSRATR
jgi:hypothetical protein